MKILVIGASRGIGRELTRQALGMGHRVTVLARYPDRISPEDGDLRVLRGDILDLKSVEAAVAGQEAVCVTVGIKPTRRPVTVFSEGTRNVLAAMDMAGVPLLIAVTGIGAGDSRGHGGFLYDRLIQPTLLRSIYQDKDRQERLIRESPVDWVVVRPGFLTNGPLTGKFRTITDMKGERAGKISRADVAFFILGQCDSASFLKKTPLLTY